MSDHVLFFKLDYSFNFFKSQFSSNNDLIILMTELAYFAPLGFSVFKIKKCDYEQS